MEFNKTKENSVYTMDGELIEQEFIDIATSCFTDINIRNGMDLICKMTGSSVAESFELMKRFKELEVEIIKNSFDEKLIRIKMNMVYEIALKIQHRTCSLRESTEEDMEPKNMELESLEEESTERQL